MSRLNGPTYAMAVKGMPYTQPLTEAIYVSESDLHNLILFPHTDLSIPFDEKNEVKQSFNSADFILPNDVMDIIVGYLIPDLPPPEKIHQPYGDQLADAYAESKGDQDLFKEKILQTVAKNHFMMRYITPYYDNMHRLKATLTDLQQQLLIDLENKKFIKQQIHNVKRMLYAVTYTKQFVINCLVKKWCKAYASYHISLYIMNWFGSASVIHNWRHK